MNTDGLWIFLNFRLMLYVSEHDMNGVRNRLSLERGIRRTIICRRWFGSTLRVVRVTCAGMYIVWDITSWYLQVRSKIWQKSYVMKDIKTEKGERSYDWNGVRILVAFRKDPGHYSKVLKISLSEFVVRRSDIFSIYLYRIMETFLTFYHDFLVYKLTDSGYDR